MSARVARVPLRVRIAAAFVVTTGLVLGALSVFLHQRLADELDASLRAALRTRAGDLAGDVRRSGSPQLPDNALVERGDDVAQILDRAGRVVRSAPGLGAVALLRPAQARRASRHPLVADRVELPDDDDDVMLVAAPAGRFVAVVGADLSGRDRALNSLDGLLATGVPIALLLAGVAGFVVAGAGLRPVERIRRRAEAIGTGDLAQRLPVPPARDEVGRLAATLNAMLARLQDGFERERTFVADASHELRTPIARLKAELELADDDRRSAGELRAAVRSARAETDLLGRLADDLLVLARADQGRLPVRPEPLALAPFLREAAGRCGVPAAVVDCPPGLTAHADPVRLHQALGNLLDNAERHGGGVTAIVAARHGDQVRIRVGDAGSGVPPALRPHAFERFTRADAAREEGGAGLGLSIVAAVARAHGGAAGIGDDGVWIGLPTQPPPPR